MDARTGLDELQLRRLIDSGCSVHEIEIVAELRPAHEQGEVETSSPTGTTLEAVIPAQHVPLRSAP